MSIVDPSRPSAPTTPETLKPGQPLPPPTVGHSGNLGLETPQIEFNTPLGVAVDKGLVSPVPDTPAALMPTAKPEKPSKTKKIVAGLVATATLGVGGVYLLGQGEEKVTTTPTVLTTPDTVATPTTEAEAPVRTIEDLTIDDFYTGEILNDADLDNALSKMDALTTLTYINYDQRIDNLRFSEEYRNNYPERFTGQAEAIEKVKKYREKHSLTPEQFELQFACGAELGTFEKNPDGSVTAVVGCSTYSTDNRPGGEMLTAIGDDLLLTFAMTTIRLPSGESFLAWTIVDGERV